LKEKPDAKIGILFQNDDYGKDYLKGFKDALGPNGLKLIVTEESYETTEPTIDSHIVRLKASGADVFFDASIPKFAAQAIKKNAEIEWKPLHFLNSRSSSIGATIKPAGFDAAQGIISSAYLPSVERRSRNEEVQCLPGQVLSGSKPERRVCSLRLHSRTAPVWRCH
jgi:branched-chain amino acid transport system substrate-binding protein